MNVTPSQAGEGRGPAHLRVLVTGGAGYIGSHMIKRLLSAGHHVTVLDDLSTGHRDSVQGAPLVVADVGDRERVEGLLKSTGARVVMHFAGFIQVGESVTEPERYHRNNVEKTAALLQACVAAGVEGFVFSSSAAVYGEPKTDRLREDHPCAPLNPYGRSKLEVEQMLERHARGSGLRSVSFRYFNAAGADPDGELGERHRPETHLIPLALEAAAGAADALTVFGDDYPTPDGTCVRDYVHVSDLCEAHLLGMHRLLECPRGKILTLNLGNDRGYSVREIIAEVERVTGRRVAVKTGVRRPGDQAVLVADSSKARALLGWTPRHAAIGDIITHAWAWRQKTKQS